MLGKKFNISDRRNSLFTFLASALMFFLLAGCASTGTYGTLDRDYELDKKFSSYEVLQDYNYFESGGAPAPNAILLISKDYELENSSNLWKPVPDVDYNQMKSWLGNIRSHRYLNKSGGYFAAYILDPDGRKVGVWYSVEVFATVKFLGGNKLLVNTPDPFKRYVFWN